MSELSPAAAIGVFSGGILRIPHLPALLEAPVVAAAWGRLPRPVSAVAGWGRRPTAARAMRHAQQHGLPYLALEDGFLRSVEPGRREAPLSLVVDDMGVYYDATRPSRIEALIARPLSAAETARAEALIAAWRAGRVSKYNHSREYAGVLPERYVLVADQTFGDASVGCGLAGPESFRDMLAAALAGHPDCTVLVKTHPEVVAGIKKGYFEPAALADLPRVRVLAEDAHPVRLIEQAQAVYVVTSQLGFEALLWGRPVRTFGMPFYAGWGLTQDQKSAPAGRRGRASLAQLAHAALVGYPRYVDPETGERCEAERLVEWMALQRRMREKFPPQLHALGFSLQKRPVVRRFLQGSEVRFVRRAEQLPAGASVAVWGRRDAGVALPPGATLLRLEDGFLRSVGLGADLIRPLSWVVDGRGIYYDASGPSDLEDLLQNAEFDAALLARARALRQRIVEGGLTKYNVGAGGWRRAEGAGRVILVPGQVESDASLAWGAPGIRGNIDLLRRVREANPDAHVIYKPHPDVVAGLRRRGRGEDAAARWCDEVLTEVAMGALLAQVDEVHTLTSLAGFEALLRGRKVACHGLPFYAGWGLTADSLPCQRRRARLSLDQLVAGVLIMYPAYVSRRTGRYATPERALDELLAWREREPSRPPLWRRGLRQVLGLMKT